MKTNISTLMNLISKEERKLNNINFAIKDYAINTQIEELDGRVNIIEDNKELFDLNLKEVFTSTKELSKLKSILYEKNNEFKLSDGRSIQQAIVENTYLRKIKSTLEQIILIKNSKKRITEVTNSYFECVTTNFDSNYIRKKIEELDNEIQKTDFEISKLNSIEFTI